MNIKQAFVRAAADYAANEGGIVEGRLTPPFIAISLSINGRGAFNLGMLYMAPPTFDGLTLGPALFSGWSERGRSYLTPVAEVSITNFETIAGQVVDTVLVEVSESGYSGITRRFFTEDYPPFFSSDLNQVLSSPAAYTPQITIEVTSYESPQAF